MDGASNTPKQNFKNARAEQEVRNLFGYGEDVRMNWMRVYTPIQSSASGDGNYWSRVLSKIKNYGGTKFRVIKTKVYKWWINSLHWERKFSI
jgi:hypothetical protein